MHLFAFDMNCVGHINHGLWRHPRDRSLDYNNLDYWTNLAMTAERGLFDGIFLADIAGVYDVYGGGPDASIRAGAQIPVNDPIIPLSAMAHVTRHIGFGVTVNATYEPPYILARRFSTLDHLTKGRIGWNIVTGYLDSAARAMGLSRLPDHDSRYQEAEEVLEILYRLWEDSWDRSAVHRNREIGLFADPAGVRAIDFEGRTHRVNAIHLSEPSPQRTPLLFQAGASARGQDFAARHAECVFLAGSTPERTRPLVEALHARAEAFGRPRGSLKTLQLLTTVVGRTTAEAEEKLADYRRYASTEAALAHYSSSIGIDLSTFGDDEPIAALSTNANQSALEALKASGPTLRQIRSEMTLGSRQKPVTGSAEQVADILIDWMDRGGVDGFNLARTVTPESLEDFIALVVPILQEKGRFRTAYGEGTLRRKLFGRDDELPADHPARARRQL